MSRSSSSASAAGSPSCACCAISAFASACRVEDVYGTGITFAALAHLAHTLPPRNVFGLYDYVVPEVPLLTNLLRAARGRVALPPDCGPGLGVEVDEAFLGKPVRVFQ